jgi:hypothetical protein
LHIRADFKPKGQQAPIRSIAKSSPRASLHSALF